MRFGASVALFGLALAGFHPLRAEGSGTLPSGPVHGSFAQSKTVQGLSRPLRSVGSFAVVPGRGLVWRTEKPLKGELVLTPRGVFAVEGSGSRKISAGGDVLKLMDQILAGDASALERSFVVRRSSTAQGWILDLEPKPGPLAEVFRSIRAEGSGFARSAQLSETSGDRTALRFEAVAAGPGKLSRTEESLLEP